MHPDVEKILLSKDEIDEIVGRMAAQINEDYAGKTLLCVGILKGSCVFMMDLIRRLTDVDVEIDFMVASSYGSSAQSSGVVKITKDLSRDIEGLDVLIVEDILDTGNTLTHLMGVLRDRKAASVELAVFLEKDLGIERAIKPKYLGGICPDEFVIGYGLDYNEKYRQLPYLGALKREIYS